MVYAVLYSILFMVACIASLVIGIFVLQNNHKDPSHRCFFAMIVAIGIWSVGLALATSAPDSAACETWRRVASLGWGTLYSIFLHFVFLIIGKKQWLQKWGSYFLLYLPAVIMVLAFAVPSGINPTPYQLHLTEFGWVNVAENNIWDWLFYIYYIGYSIIGLLLIFQWGRKSSNTNIKKQSHAILLSFAATLVLASITDVFINSTIARIPQMAPIIMLLPVTVIYHTIRKRGFIDSKPVETRGNFIRILFSVILYMMIHFLLTELSKESSLFKINFEPAALRGIIAQLQVFICVYLAIREDRPGYITAILLNTYAICSSVIFAIRNESTAPLPGVMVYFGVFLILALIISNKKKTTFHIRKIEEQKNFLEASKKKLHHMAFYDSLTGLPNKYLFVNRLEQAIHAAKRHASLIGVIFIDLDSFKAVNDTMGHTMGDFVLKKVAEQLSSCLRKGDTVSRFGGDEFLIQVGNITRVEDLYKITDKLMAVFKNAITMENNEFFISPSMGVSVYPVDGEDTETLIKNADIAMYSAKYNGKNQCVYCSTEMKNDIVRNLKLTNSLYRALDKNELFIHYQPQVNTKTKKIIGFEALLRWKHETFGMVSPAVFIPMAEKTGLINPIGLWVMKTACEQFHSLRKYTPQALRLSVNLSVEQLKDVHIAEKIQKVLADTGMAAESIQIEITESTAFTEEPYILQRLLDLKKLGLSISIDDFGTGHSSLSRLKVFPIDLIKIDMEFVRGITSESKKDKAMIKSIIQIAKNLGIDVLAEGVETEEQYQYLRKNNCNEIQGYYFYKPMPIEEIKTILSLDKEDEREKNGPALSIPPS